MRTIKFRAWVKPEKCMIGHRETIERAHLQFNDNLGGYKDIIMQFTELSDKNGKEIYEGDILLTNEAGWIAPVIYDYGSFYCKDAQGGFGCVIWDECEIIGNIYENPELLK